jgi:hypothetical protein
MSPKVIKQTVYASPGNVGTVAYRGGKTLAQERMAAPSDWLSAPCHRVEFAGNQILEQFRGGNVIKVLRDCCQLSLRARSANVTRYGCPCNPLSSYEAGLSDEEVAVRRKARDDTE